MMGKIKINDSLRYTNKVCNSTYKFSCYIFIEARFLVENFITVEEKLTDYSKTNISFTTLRF